MWASLSVMVLYELGIGVPQVRSGWQNINMIYNFCFYVALSAFPTSPRPSWFESELKHRTETTGVFYNTHNPVLVKLNRSSGGPLA